MIPFICLECGFHRMVPETSSMPPDTTHDHSYQSEDGKWIISKVGMIPLSSIQERFGYSGI